MASLTETPDFRQIGKGFCGSIWAVDRDGEAFALKRGDVSTDRSVQNDAEMHQRIEESFERCKTILQLTHLNIPRYQTLVRKGNMEWWNARKARFPPQKSFSTTFQLEPCDTLISERILPFSKLARTAIIENFCPEKLKEKVASRRENEDCLVRLYLGRRTDSQKRPSRFFQLRNCILDIEKLESLALPLDDYARTMAGALAFMYWHAKVDANDVEFVLAPKGCHPDSGSWQSDIIGEHTIWLLDFDCVKPISMDADGVEQAALAFYRNDPYFPRPCGNTQKDKVLWTIFVQHFFRSSQALLGDSPLPQMFIDRIENIGQESEVRRPGSVVAIEA